MQSSRYFPSKVLAPPEYWMTRAFQKMWIRICLEGFIGFGLL